MNTLFSIFYQAWSLTIEMAPYLLLGFLAAGFLHVFIPIDIIGRHLGRESVPSVFKASLFGVPIPLCSCGVLPVAASIRKSGASKSATLSFLITTPVTGVDSLMATWALLGWAFTIIRLITSIIIGFVSGFIMIFIFKMNNNQAVDDIDDSCDVSSCCGSECAPKDAATKSTETKFIANLKKALHYAFVELPGSFSGSLLFGLILAGIISYLLPPELVKQHLGAGILGIITATLIAIPLYVCSTGSIPIAAAMIATGFSPGAALAFLIAGPATNTIAILTIKKLLGKMAIFVYISTIFIGAIGFGLILDFFNIQWLAVSIMSHMDHGYSLFKIICAVILLAIILPLYVKEKRDKYFNKIEIDGDESINSMILSTPDISCNHCVNTVKKTLSQFSEIDNVAVDVNSKKVSITLNGDIDKEKILSAMKEAGYPSLME